jgi:hypothetical protein
VARDKLPLLSRFFNREEVTDAFAMSLKGADNGCPPPTFQCPQIDES